MLIDRLPDFIRESYECHEWKHASAILSQDFPLRVGRPFGFVDRIQA